MSRLALDVDRRFGWPGGILDKFLHPSEEPLPRDGVLTSIAVAYRPRDLHVFGWDTNWLVAYFGLTLLFMMVLRRPLGVVL